MAGMVWLSTRSDGLTGTARTDIRRPCEWEPPQTLNVRDGRLVSSREQRIGSPAMVIDAALLNATVPGPQVRRRRTAESRSRPPARQQLLAGPPVAVFGDAAAPAFAGGHLVAAGRQAHGAEARQLVVEPVGAEIEGHVDDRELHRVRIAVEAAADRPEQPAGAAQGDVEIGGEHQLGTDSGRKRRCQNGET